MPLILASTSQYKRKLMEQLQLPFLPVTPPYQEEHQLDLPPSEKCVYLAEQKARSLQLDYPEAVIIGSDQILISGDRQFGKPLREETALEQLLWMQIHRNVFYTGLAVYDPLKRVYYHGVEPCEIKLRQLAKDQLECYIRKDNPLQCAGAFKAETLGIVLLEKIETRDYTSLIGLPLIQLVGILNEIGYPILSS